MMFTLVELATLQLTVVGYATSTSRVSRFSISEPSPSPPSDPSSREERRHLCARGPSCARALLRCCNQSTFLIKVAMAVP
jgi:hypothetical protein